jgi:ABC-type Fe3+-hydroxamate transport system substrate-binding protein
MAAFSFVHVSGRHRAAALCLALLAAPVACRPEARPAATSAWRDDYGDTIVVTEPARRVVSLNPTTTEILFALGAGDRLVGRSRWDKWPDAALAVPDVGDGIRPSIERVMGARPDLVLLYASGDNRDAARALGAAGIRVVALKIDSIAEFERAVRLLGALTGTHKAAQAIVDSVTWTLGLVREATRDLRRPSLFIHVWDNPLMVIGGGSFMSELVDIAGGRNVYADLALPSAQISFEDLVQRDPDAVLAGPDVAARMKTDPRWSALRAIRSGRLLSYDTVLVARPSVRLGEAAWSLARLLHPGVFR